MFLSAHIRQWVLGFDDSHGASVVHGFCACQFSSFSPFLEGHLGFRGSTMIMAWFDSAGPSTWPAQTPCLWMVEEI
jgi:hypothetical protein